MDKDDFNHIGSRLSTETPGHGVGRARAANFNHIGSRLSTETAVWTGSQWRELNFNHIGSRLSTETTRMTILRSVVLTFQPHRLTVEH